MKRFMNSSRLGRLNKIEHPRGALFLSVNQHWIRTFPSLLSVVCLHWFLQMIAIAPVLVLCWVHSDGLLISTLPWLLWMIKGSSVAFFWVSWAWILKASMDSKAAIIFVFIVFPLLNVFVLLQEKKDDAHKASYKKYAYVPKKFFNLSWSIANINFQLNGFQVNAFK